MKNKFLSLVLALILSTSVSAINLVVDGNPLVPHVPPQSIDGDTIVVNFNGVEEKVRLIGIDTSESVHPDGDRNSEEGTAASDFTKTALEGK